MVTFLATYWILFLMGTCIFIGLASLDDDESTPSLSHKGLFCGILGMFCGVLTTIGAIVAIINVVQ